MSVNQIFRLVEWSEEENPLISKFCVKKWREQCWEVDQSQERERQYRKVEMRCEVRREREKLARERMWKREKEREGESERERERRGGGEERKWERRKRAKSNGLSNFENVWMMNSKTLWRFKIVGLGRKSFFCEKSFEWFSQKRASIIFELCDATLVPR